MPPATGRPFSTIATETQNSGMPATNSRVPSRGSTTQTRLFSKRVKSSTLSSDSQPSPSRSSSLRRTASTALSASVTGSCPALYSASIAPEVKRLKTTRLASSAERMRCRVSVFEQEAMNVRSRTQFQESQFAVASSQHLALCDAATKSGAEHSGAGRQQNCAQNPSQPGHRYAGTQVRTQQSARDRADQ